MGIIVLCGLLYILSGSNLLGFETAPRISEMFLGGTIASAVVFSIKKKKRLSSFFFLIGPVFHFAQAFETGLTQGTYDWFQLAAFCCFTVSGITARYIKKPEPPPVPAL